MYIYICIYTDTVYTYTHYMYIMYIIHVYIQYTKHIHTCIHTERQRRVKHTLGKYQLNLLRSKLSTPNTIAIIM